MDQNQDRVQSNHSQQSSPAVGEFRVGSDIQATTHGASEEGAVKPVEGKAQDAPRNQVVGENSGVVGDSDAMTSGSSAYPAPDDTAMRNLDRATKHGHTADKPSDLETLSGNGGAKEDAG